MEKKREGMNWFFTMNFFYYYKDLKNWKQNPELANLFVITESHSQQLHHILFLSHGWLANYQEKMYTLPEEGYMSYPEMKYKGCDLSIS